RLEICRSATCPESRCPYSHPQPEEVQTFACVGSPWSEDSIQTGGVFQGREILGGLIIANGLIEIKSVTICRPVFTNVSAAHDTIWFECYLMRTALRTRRGTDGRRNRDRSSKRRFLVSHCCLF